MSYCVAVQADGRILIAGSFTAVNGQPRNGIARLNADGTVESASTFNPGTGVAGGLNPSVVCLALQADGKILISGYFTSVNGEPRDGFARLLTDGTVETIATFNPPTGSSGIQSIVSQADGKILVGGGAFGGAGVSRLLSDGTLESTATFNPNFGSEGYSVFSIALQADGNILVGGGFSSVNGQTRNKVARLANDEAAQSLDLADPTKVRWLRGGAAPEVEQVSFEISTNGGVGWSLLGPGTRIPGGWELAGLNLTGIGSIRARGRTSGGANNSSGLVESVAAFPIVPSLSIARSDAGVSISWITPETGLILQQTDLLGTPTVWSNTTELASISGQTNTVQQALVPANRFFRLYRP